MGDDPERSAVRARLGFYDPTGAHGVAPVGIASIAPCAAFGAFYFLASAVSLAVSDACKVR